MKSPRGASQIVLHRRHAVLGIARLWPDQHAQDQCWKTTRHQNDQPIDLAA
jgi:hypothetical protein